MQKEIFSINISSLFTITSTILNKLYGRHVILVYGGRRHIIRQIQQAELAREYQRKLGYTSPGQLTKMISHGKLENGTIVAQDVLSYVNKNTQNIAPKYLAIRFPRNYLLLTEHLVIPLARHVTVQERSREVNR
jgi:hypothetical protein